MLLSIVTLNYKKPDLTISCLESLWQQYADELQNHEMEVLVVDNDSQDDSVGKIKREITGKKFHNMRVIANLKNVGFGAGCNVGAKESKGKYILFLNNDTIVQDKGVLKMAQYCEEHSEVAILGGQLTNSDGSLQSSVGKFYTLWYAFLLLTAGQRFWLVDKNPGKIEKVDWVKGSLLMIRKSIFEELGGFDENIFMYTEDMELCYRAHLKGLGVYFYPDVSIIHKEHGSGNRTFAIVNIYKNLLYFYKKHRSPGEYRLVKSMMIAKARSLIAIGKLTKKQYLVETYENAVKEI